eukprot:TRINITY_DN383_c0_g2_i1.p2 TRINITY_DN383_c0_g2~~TRINITY_DN383_c0_g2_i1.p2  ORF type:complete len:104 (+),score=9.92 TRINITY_DN383_c0_g2_i1:390-701(+)
MRTESALSSLHVRLCKLEEQARVPAAVEDALDHHITNRPPKNASCCSQSTLPCLLYASCQPRFIPERNAAISRATAAHIDTLNSHRRLPPWYPGRNTRPRTLR